MAANLADLHLEDYRPTELEFDCRRCQRHAIASTFALKARYGNPSLGELARRVAASGTPPCTLAGIEGQARCSAVPVEPEVQFWAKLRDALHGGWTPWLHCQRRLAGLKRATSCPGPLRLDVPSLVAVLGDDFRLERLPMRLECPGCGTKAVGVEWEEGHATSTAR